jgi:hypothetical protein
MPSRLYFDQLSQRWFMLWSIPPNPNAPTSAQFGVRVSKTAHPWSVPQYDGGHWCTLRVNPPATVITADSGPGGWLSYMDVEQVEMGFSSDKLVLSGLLWGLDPSASYEEATKLDESYVALVNKTQLVNACNAAANDPFETDLGVASQAAGAPIRFQEIMPASTTSNGPPYRILMPAKSWDAGDSSAYLTAITDPRDPSTSSQLLRVVKLIGAVGSVTRYTYDLDTGSGLSSVPVTGALPCVGGTGRRQLPAYRQFVTSTLRGGHLWTAGNVGCTPSGDTQKRGCIRYFDLNASTLAIQQNIKYGLADNDVYAPGLDVLPDGTMVTVFNRSGANQFMGSWMSGRRPADAANTLRYMSARKQGTSCPYLFGGLNAVSTARNQVVTDPAGAALFAGAGYDLLLNGAPVTQDWLDAIPIDQLPN